MYANKLKLQKELFDPIREKLIFVINVNKIGRKRKSEQVCVTLTISSPQHIYIHQVIQSEKDNYKSKRHWQINQLRLVDGKERINSSNTLEFELHFERAFKWSATHVGDKSSFLSALYKVICQFADKSKIELRNLDVTRLKKDLYGMNHLYSDRSSADAEDQELAMLGLPEDGQEEYQDLSAKEEQDLNKLFNQTTWAISNSEAFTGQLVGELELLDQQNIETIMRSEVQITQLMVVLDNAVQELERMSDHLVECETLLQAARESIEVVQLRDTNLDVEERNSKLLYKDIQALIGKLELDSNTQDILLHQPLTGDCLSICTDRAFHLLAALNQEFDSGTAMMRSVIDQKQSLNSLKDSFVVRLHRHLVFEFKEAMPRESADIAYLSEYPSLPSHDRAHKKLVLYSRLSLWLKIAEPDRLQDIIKDYISAAAPLYSDEFRNFFHEIKKSAFKVHDKSKLPLKRTGSRAIPTGSTLEIPDLYASKSSSIGHLVRSESISSNISNFSEGSSVEESDKFEHTFFVLLHQFQPICQREQTFLENFFHFSEEGSASGFREDSYRTAAEHTQLEVGRTMNQDLKLCLTKLFDTLKPELEGFINRVNDSGSPFQILYVLQYIYSKVKPKVIDPSSMNYFEICLNYCLPSLQNHFDKYFSSFKRQIEDIRNVKRTKESGILACVRKVVTFLVSAKSIMSKFEFTNIGHLERYFLTLMESVSKTIEKSSFELNKTRGDVCRFENYQFMFSKLSELKIKCLEGCKEEAKKKSREFVDSYTRSMLGRPLEKLSLFFEGVESQLKKGTKPEEIGFISEFHKTELRRCVSMYPGKEVRKVLDTIYKKVDKHLSPEMGMNQVVWHQMQTQLILQFQNITNLIESCYSDANVKLDFTIKDLYGFFSDIRL